MSRTVSTRLTDEDLALVIDCLGKHYQYVPTSLSELTRLSIRLFMQQCGIAPDTKPSAKALQVLESLNRTKGNKTANRLEDLMKVNSNRSRPAPAPDLTPEELPQSSRLAFGEYDLSPLLTELSEQSAQQLKSVWSYLTQGIITLEDIFQSDKHPAEVKELVAFVILALPPLFEKLSAPMQKEIRKWK